MKPFKFLRSSLAKAITPWHYVSATALVALTVLGSQPAQAVMLDLGSLTGSEPVQAQAISGDGTVVGLIGGNNRELFRWTMDKGMTSLGSANAASIAGVSNDGTYVIGSYSNNTFSFRWDAANGFVDLGNLGGDETVARGISDDGSVIVGNSNTSAGALTRAFRWENGVMQDLGTIRPGNTRAWAISGDGQVVVGNSGSLAFRWDNTNGMSDLGNLGGQSSRASAANRDGSVIVGYSATSGALDDYHAFRWTELNGMQDLGTLGGNTSFANDINADGSVIVGKAQQADGADRAFLWTDATGMTSLGVLSGTTSSEATGVSDDGKTVVGTSGNRAFIWNESFVLPGLAGMQDLNYLQTSIIRSAVTVSHLTASQNRRLRDLAQEQCQPGAAQTYCLSLGSQNYRGDADSSATQKNLNLSAGMRLNEQYSAGVTGSLGRADLNVQSAEQKKAFALGVWGAFQQNADDTGWGGAASVAVGQSENSFDRGMALTDVQRARAHLDLTGTALRVAGNFGMRMNTPLGDSLITPEVALSHVSTQQDGFTERSVALPLTVKGSNEQRTYATFGVRSATQVSPKGTLNLALAVDTLLSDNTQGIEGHSKVPGLSRFNLDSSVDQRRVIPTATVGYSHALTANSALGGGVQVATSTHQDGAPLFGLGMQYRYSF